MFTIWQVLTDFACLADVDGDCHVCHIGLFWGPCMTDKVVLGAMYVN